MLAVKNSILRNMFSYTPVVLLSAGSQFASVVVFTHLIAADAYGRYALVMALVQVVDILVFGWLRAGEMRFYEAALVRDELAKLYAGTQLVLASACLVLMLVGVPLALWVVPDQALSLALSSGILLLVVRAAAQQAMVRLRMQGDVIRFSLFEILRSLLCLAIPVILALVFDIAEQSLLLGMAGVTLAVLPFTLRTAWVRFNPRMFDRSMLRDCWTFSYPAILGSLLADLVILSDRYLIGLFEDAAAVGVFSAATSIARQSIALLFSVTLLANYPLLIQASERDGRNAARDRLRDNFAALLALCIPATVGVALTARHLTAICLGAEFQEAGGMIPWIVVATFITGVKVHAVDHIFHLEKRTMLLLMVNIPITLGNIVLTAALVPYWGTSGAILASLVAALTGLAATIAVGSRLMILPVPVDTLWRTLLSTAFMAAALTGVTYPETPAGLGTMVATGAVVYTSAGILLNLLGCRSMLVDLIRSAVRP